LLAFHWYVLIAMLIFTGELMICILQFPTKRVKWEFMLFYCALECSSILRQLSKP